MLKNYLISIQLTQIYSNSKGSASPSYSLTSPNPASPHHYSPVSPTYSPASMNSYSVSSHPSMSPSFHQQSSYSPLSPQQYVSFKQFSLILLTVEINWYKIEILMVFFSFRHRHRHPTVRHRLATAQPHHVTLRRALHTARHLHRTGKYSIQKFIDLENCVLLNRLIQYF